MSNSSRAELALTGADCFLRAFDDEVRRRNGASHASQLVLRLGPGFDAPGLTRLIEKVTAKHKEQEAARRKAVVADPTPWGMFVQPDQ